MTGDGSTVALFDRTRRTVHGVAEQVLAGYSRRVGGSIRLYVRDGALSTADLPGAVSRLELRGGAVVRQPSGTAVPLQGTFGALAERLGVPFGMPDPPYSLSSGCSATDAVEFDAAALTVIEDAWRVGDLALRGLAPDQVPVVWPEHLDIAVTVTEVNYGVSPGDGYLGEPYAYVGPHRPRSGEFWNAPFGAVLPLAALEQEAGPALDRPVDGAGAQWRVHAVRAFFDRGRALADR